MSSKMHFRKRLLQEYQHEVGLTLFGTEFSPPSSVNTDNIDNKSNSSNSPPKEWEPEIKIEEKNETVDISPDAENYINKALVLKPKSIGIFDSINLSKQRLEASFEEEKQLVASPDLKPSTIVLENINQVNGNLHSQSKQTNNILEFLAQENSIFQNASFIKPHPQGVSKHFDLLRHNSRRRLTQKIRYSGAIKNGRRLYNNFKLFTKNGIKVCDEIGKLKPFGSPAANEENIENKQTIIDNQLQQSFYDKQGSSTPVQFRRPYYQIGNYNEIENENNFYPIPSPNCEDKIIIGPNNTEMLKCDYEKIDWSLSTPNVTRQILMTIFGRATLATHSLSGRPSPAFKNLNKPEKLPLDTYKVADMIFIITRIKNASAKEVRMAITTKCADECKMLKVREEKKKKFIAMMEQQNQTVFL